MPNLEQLEQQALDQIELANQQFTTSYEEISTAEASGEVAEFFGGALKTIGYGLAGAAAGAAAVGIIIGTGGAAAAPLIAALGSVGTAVGASAGGAARSGWRSSSSWRSSCNNSRSF